MMKKPMHLILTHGAVFSIGIAAAMIINSGRNTQATSSKSSTNPDSSSSHSRSSGNQYSTDSSSSSPTRDSQRSLSAKEKRTSSEQLNSIVRISDVSERQRALMNLIDTLGPSEFKAVADQFRELDHFGDSRGEYSLILNGWAKTDPLSALEYVSQFSHSRSNSATILSTWASNDPAAAERWALENHEGDQANPYLPAVIQGLAINDFASASRLTQSMPLSRERGEAVNSITQALFLQGTDAAMLYPDSIADETLRGSFVAAIAKRMIAKDLEKTASWIAAIPQGEVQNRAARQVADALANEDPSRAAKWVSTLKPEAQAEAARGVIPIMSEADIAGTAKWVSSLAGTPNYDRMVEAFVWSCDTRAPEQSATWIQGISNPDQQRKLYHRMLGEWAKKDAPAVKQWVASNPVPEDVLNRFSR